MYRVEVCLKSQLPDARGLGLVKDIQDLGITSVASVRVIDIYWLDAEATPDEMDSICHQLLADPITQEYRFSRLSADTTPTHSPKASEPAHVVEVAYNPGVTDPVEETVMKAINDLGISGIRAVKTAKVTILEIRLGDGLGGKGITHLAGLVHDVEAAVEAGVTVARQRGVTTCHTVIPFQHEELRERIGRSTEFYA